MEDITMNAYRKEHDYTDEEVIDMLDEIYGEVDICGFDYSAGRALKELDPIAFHQAALDLADTNDRDNPIWVCAECESEYNNEDEAEACCKPEPDEDE